jgi:transcriptional regulator with XRE-family HTH domain
VNYSDKLKLLIARRALTHKQAADLFGCKQHVMTRYINGRKPANPDRFKRLAEFFCVSVDVLMDDSKELPPPDRSDKTDRLDRLAALSLAAEIARLKAIAADLELLIARMEGRK